VFLLDRGLERGSAVLGVLHQIEQDRLRRQEDGAGPPAAEPAEAAACDGEGNGLPTP
jgi:hypothetical protein